MGNKIIHGTHHLLRRIGHIFVLSSLFLTTAAFSQKLLTLDDCLRVALEHNIAFQIASNEHHAAELAKDEVGKTVLPEVKIGGKALDAPHSGQRGYDPALSNGGEFSAQIGVQELLYDGGIRGTKSQQLSLDIDRMSIEQRRAERDLRYSLTLAFLDALEARGELELDQEQEKELTEYSDLVTRLYHGGGISYTDVLKTDLGLQNSHLAVERAYQAYASSKITLAGVMGTPLDTSFSLQGEIDVPDSAQTFALLGRAVVDSAANLDLQSTEIAARRSIFDVDLAKSERLPSVFLTGDVGYLSSGDNLNLPSDERVNSLGYSVGVSVENLLANWGATDLRIQQRELDAENMQLAYEQQVRSVRGDVERMRSELVSGFSQTRMIQRILKVSIDNFTVTKAQYAGGASSALEVLSAQQSLAENRISDLHTRATLQRLVAKLHQFLAR